jgi:hypothetical protein
MHKSLFTAALVLMTTSFATVGCADTEEPEEPKGSTESSLSMGCFGKVKAPRGTKEWVEEYRACILASSELRRPKPGGTPGTDGTDGTTDDPPPADKPTTTPPSSGNKCTYTSCYNGTCTVTDC